MMMRKPIEDIPYYQRQSQEKVRDMQNRVSYIDTYTFVKVQYVTILYGRVIAKVAMPGFEAVEICTIYGSR